MSKPSSTRRPLGFISHPQIQIKYALLNAGFITLLMASIYAIAIINIRFMIDPPPQDELVYYALLNSFNLMTWTAVLMCTVAFSFTFISTLYITHRFIGPTVTIRRFIDQLMKGENPEPLKLRRLDELGLIAEKLNELRDAYPQKMADK